MVLKGIEEAVVGYCNERHKGDRLAVRDCYDEMVNYLELYSNDILDVSAVRRGSKYCVGNISFVNIYRKNLFESVYPVFVNFLAEKVVTRRVYTILADIVCCLDSDVRYEPTEKSFVYKEDYDVSVGDAVEQSLGEWFYDYAVPAMREIVRYYGDEKCKTLSPSLYLCDWDIIRSDVWEERE